MAGIVIGVDTSSAFSNVKNLTKALDDLGRQGIVTESEIKKLTEEAKKKFAADDAERSAAKLGNTLDRVAKSCGMTAGELYLLKAKAGVASTEMEKLGSHANVVSSAMQVASSNLSSFGGAMGSIGTKIAALAAGFLSLQTAMQAATTVASMEAMKASFDGIFGDKGAEQFKYVMDSANKYGKSVDDIAGSYKKFAAAAEYVGISTENVRKIFESTTQAITKVGGTSQDVSGALLAISQSLGKGVVMSEEFKGQFSERIPVAMKVAADAMGVTTAEFQKMMESGQVMAVDFWPKIADGMANFSQGWQKSSDTVVSNFERVKNSMKDLAATDIAQGTGSFVGKFLSDSIIQRVNQVKESFRYISVMYQTMQNMQTPELPQFSPVLFSIDELEQRLGRLKDRQNGYIAGLKDGVESLTKSLAEAQSKQLDFGPSGENVDVMRQKLKWFQDLLLQLTGQTHVVNVTANVDMSQLKQAKSYIQEIIKGTSEAKGRAIDDERAKLDNAVKVLGKNKADLEAQLSNPNADLREKGGVAQQIEAINKDLYDAKLGYDELSKQQKRLTEQQIKDNSEVKKFNESRGGVNSSDLTYDTQRIDAERLSIARQTDAWREYQAGLKTLPETYEIVSRAQEAETVTQDKITKAIERESKSRSNGATAAARYAERTFSYLEQAQDQYDQLVAMMGGDTLAAKIAGIEKRYDKAASAIRQAMIGAKGSTAELDAALEQLEKNKAIEKLMAQAEAWRKSMQDAANLLGEIGRLSGDPSAIYGSEMTTAQLWEADQQKRINAIEDETEREKQLGELRQAMALKEVAARADAYEGVAAVSSKYWESERELLEQRLSIAKANADDELAYRIYAAQQWDEYNKKKVEQQATTGRSFSDVFAAKWSLHYGGYKSEMTKTQESWSNMSESIINATDGMIDGVSGGIGDMIRNIGNGTASIEDLWKNMLARMLDAFASFIEEAIKQWLKDMVGGMFSGASSSQPTVQGMAGGGNYGGGALWGGLAAALGKTSGSGSDAATSASKSLTEAYLFSGELNPTGQQLAAATGGVSAATGLMSKVASWLPVAGAVIGIGGSLLGMLLGNDKKKKEPTKLYDGTQTIVSSGVAGSLQYEVMSDGSLKAKVMDPQDITEAQKAFKELTKSVKDAAKALNIDLVADFDKTFTLITGVVTDELKDTAQWVMQSAYGQSALGDLSGAVQFFSSGMENMVEIFTGLAESIQNVKGRIEALGIDFTKFSGITDALLSQVAEFATDEYVSMKSVAKSSGSVESVVEAMTTAATSVDDLAQAATDAAEYLAKYRDEITSLAEAAVSQLYEDALGGKDSYTSAMDIYAKYGITTKAEKQSALDYYTGKLSDLLGDFTSDFSSVLVSFDQTGISAKNVSSFWSAYNAAMQQTMSPKMLAAWAEMASYAALIEDTSKALEKAEHDSLKLSSDLQYRQKVAAGLEKEAAITKLLADYENELFEARQNDYTYSEQALLVETQVVELQAKLNDLLGETADATSSYDEALTQLTDSVSNQAKALSSIASTASGLESAYSSAADSLEGLLDTVLEELTTGAGFFLDARLQDFDALYKKAVSGDSESMSKLSESASKVWESIKAGGVSPEEYDTAYWTLVNKTATAQELAKSKEDYNKIIADLSQQQVDILNAIKDELASDSPDDSIISLGNSLEQILNNFQAAYDDHITGLLSGDSYKGQMAATEKALTSWVALAASGATVGADQLSRIGGLGGSYLAAHAGESSVSAASLTEALGGSAFIQQLMDGNIRLSGLSEQQAALLGSAMASLETITGLTGTNLTYSDKAQYYLAQVADGVAIKDWTPVIDVIQAGTQEQIAAYREAIATLTAKGEELRAQAAAEAATTAAQTAYFAGIYDLLNKQTQIELYTGLISNAQETATGYLNYAVMAMSMGSAVTALSWMSQYSQVQSEIETLKAYLSYWNSYTPSVHLASGGITNGPTTALIGEGGEREVVSPLSDLQNIIDVKTPTVIVDLSELKNEIRTLREELREIKYNTKDTADNTSTSNTRAARP